MVTVTDLLDKGFLFFSSKKKKKAQLVQSTIVIYEKPRSHFKYPVISRKNFKLSISPQRENPFIENLMFQFNLKCVLFTQKKREEKTETRVERNSDFSTEQRVRENIWERVYKVLEMRFEIPFTSTEFSQISGSGNRCRIYYTCVVCTSNLTICGI